MVVCRPTDGLGVVLCYDELKVSRYVIHYTTRRRIHMSGGDSFFNLYDFLFKGYSSKNNLLS